MSTGISGGAVVITIDGDDVVVNERVAINRNGSGFHAICNRRFMVCCLG